MTKKQGQKIETIRFVGPERVPHLVTPSGDMVKVNQSNALLKQVQSTSAVIDKAKNAQLALDAWRANEQRIYDYLTDGIDGNKELEIIQDALKEAIDTQYAPREEMNAAQWKQLAADFQRLKYPDTHWILMLKDNLGQKHGGLNDAVATVTGHMRAAEDAWRANSQRIYGYLTGATTQNISVNIIQEALKDSIATQFAPREEMTRAQWKQLSDDLQREAYPAGHWMGRLRLKLFLKYGAKRKIGKDGGKKAAQINPFAAEPRRRTLLSRTH